MKNILDVVIGFPIIGLFTGFWQSLEQLNIDWNLVVGTILIQIFVVVFRSAFESFWKKYGRKWLGLSALLLFGCTVSKPVSYSGQIELPMNPDPVIADSLKAKIVLNPTQDETKKGAPVAPDSNQFPGPFTASVDTLLNGVWLKLGFIYPPGQFSIRAVFPKQTVRGTVNLKPDTEKPVIIPPASTPEKPRPPTWKEEQFWIWISCSFVAGILTMLGFGFLIWRMVK